jgi:hypothetical protein
VSDPEPEERPDEPGDVLREFRHARGRRHPRPPTFVLIGMAQTAAVLWIYGAVGLWLLVQGTRLSGPELAALQHAGPGVAGLLIGVLLVAAIRTGLRGGPLAPGRPDILHLLLAPVERRLVLRPLATRRLALSVAAAAGLGATLAGVSQSRLGGSILDWVLAGAATGALIGALSGGTAMVFAGRRLGLAWALLAAPALLLLSALDAVLGTHLSPTTWIGAVATWPLGSLDRLSLAIVPVAAVVAVVGLLGVAGGSLEALDQRANLVPLLRFQAAMQDMRGVLRTRSLLAQETPRRSPWLRLPRSPRGVGGAVWQRYWRSLLRWPAWRLARVAVLALAAAGALALVWNGFDYVLLIAGFLSYLVGMEVLEPWWQEVEHPLLTDLLPCSRPSLLLHHLLWASASAVTFGVLALPALVALRAPPLLIGVAALGLPPAAVAAVLGAALRSGPDPSWLETVGDVLTATTSPDYAMPVAGTLRVVRLAIPVGLAMAGLAPVLVARSTLARGIDPWSAEAAAGLVAVAVAALVVVGLSRVPLFVLEHR